MTLMTLRITGVSKLCMHWQHLLDHHCPWQSFGNYIMWNPSPSRNGICILATTNISVPLASGNVPLSFRHYIPESQAHKKESKSISFHHMLPCCMDSSRSASWDSWEPAEVMMVYPGYTESELVAMKYHCDCQVPHAGSALHSHVTPCGMANTLGLACNPMASQPLGPTLGTRNMLHGVEGFHCIHMSSHWACQTELQENDARVWVVYSYACSKIQLTSTVVCITANPKNMKVR